MLECNRNIHKKLTVFSRVVSLLLPIACVVLLLSQVVFAKTSYLINDGDVSFVHTTYATDPIDVLNEAGLELGEDDTYMTQEGAGMSQITVQRAQTVQIIYAGKVMEITTYGESVQSLLDRAGIVLNTGDIVSVALNTQTADGMTVTIDRNITREETYTVSTDFKTYYTFDSSLAEDEQKVLTAGSEGQILYVDRVTYFNSQETSRENLSQTQVSDPVDQVIAVGSIDGIPQDQLLLSAGDENGQTVAEYLTGNGKLYIGGGLIITSDGQILTYNDTMEVKATAYTHTDPGCNMTTSTGTTVRVGTVAVDPTVIPYGTRMFIITNDGQYVYGISAAEDCGGSIKNNRVDLYFPTTQECIQFGVRYATIYFLGEE